MKKQLTIKKVFALFLAAAMTMSAMPVWANYGGENPDDDEEVVIEQDFQTATLNMTVGEEEDVTDYLYYTWDSYNWDYDSSMVSVKRGVITARTDGYTTVTATHDYQVVAFKIGIESAEVSKTEYVSVTVGVGAAEGLGQYIELGTSDYSWSSNDSSIASVTSGGVVTGKAKGSTKVYANRSSGTSFVFNVTVEGGGSTKTSEKSITYNVGDINYLSSYVGDDASYYKWTSSNSSVAEITSAGKINALKAGNATIKATPYDVGTEYVFYITVKGSSTTETRDITVYVDDTKDLSGYVSGSASNYDWYSSDKSVATVSASGRITAKKKGSADITVYKSNTKAYVFYITVKNSSSSSSSSSKSINEKYTIYMGRDDSVDISDYLTKSASNYDWETSDKAVCKVSGSSLKAVDTGSATIKAYGSKNYQFNVKVNKAYTNRDVSVKVDGTVNLEKYLEDPVSKYDISYYSSSVASVKNSELVGKKNGYTYVIFENKNSNEIVQLMVTVSGTARVTEKATETTTQQVKETAPAEPSRPSNNGPSFNDISHRQWAVAAINNMASKGYINGRSHTVFAPDDQCSKADFTIVLTKMIGIENYDYAGGFDDVTSDKYYAKYVNVARQYGICAGVSGNSFKPQDAITREEVMYMVYKGLELKGRDLDTDTSALNAYSDAYKIDPEYKTAVAALLNEGIVSGVSDTEVDPKSTITRAQMAVLLNNIGM